MHLRNLSTRQLGRQSVRSQTFCSFSLVSCKLYIHILLFSKSPLSPKKLFYRQEFSTRFRAERSSILAFLFADFFVIEQFIVFLDFLVPVLPLFLPQEEQLRKPVDVCCSKRVIMIIQLLISPKKGCNAFNSSKTWISWTDSRTGLSISTNFPRFVDILSLGPICGYIKCHPKLPLH